MNKIFRYLIILPLIIPGVLMAKDLSLAKFTSYSEEENIKQEKIINSVLKIISRESTFEDEVDVIGGISILYPKKMSDPIVRAYSNSRESHIHFFRESQNHPWTTAKIFADKETHPLNIHLPNFNESMFIKLNLVLEKKLVSAGNDGDDSAKVISYYYKFTKNKSINVRFDVFDKMHIKYEKFPRHFNSVTIEYK